MVKMTLWVLAVVVLSTAAISCQKIESSQMGKQGELKIEDAKFRDAIPAEYGKLLTVTLDTRYTTVSNLWFEKQDGTIIAVGVDTALGSLSSKVLVISRK